MSGMAVIEKALSASRAGDVEGAIALLQQARETGGWGEAERTLLFQLLSSKERFVEAIAVAADALSTVDRALPRSNWLLRRALLCVETGARETALADLLEVQRLKANDGHVEQARAALLRVAQLRRNK